MGPDEPARPKLLEREGKELRRANDILRKASAYFAMAELDRCDVSQTTVEREISHYSESGSVFGGPGQASVITGRYLVAQHGPQYVWRQDTDATIRQLQMAGLF